MLMRMPCWRHWGPLREELTDTNFPQNGRGKNVPGTCKEFDLLVLLFTVNFWRRDAGEIRTGSRSKRVPRPRSGRKRPSNRPIGREDARFGQTSSGMGRFHASVLELGAQATASVDPDRVGPLCGLSGMSQPTSISVFLVKASVP